MARLSVLCSGSSGNCSYIRYGYETVLIDAGVSAKRMSELLYKNNIEPSSIKGIFITHEHIDHVKGLRVFSEKYDIKVFANSKTLSALSAMNSLPKEKYLHTIEPDETVYFDSVSVTAFKTSHDAICSQCYKISCSDGRTASYITDLGVFSDDIFEIVKGSDAVILEANHDLHMLYNGPYPYPVKERIAGESGHLSNEASAQAAVKLVSSNTTRLILSHISKENNTSSLALNTVDCALSKSGFKKGKDYLIYAAEKEDGREYIF